MQPTWKEVELTASVGSISLKQMSKKRPRMSTFPQTPTHLLLQMDESSTSEREALKDELHLHKPADNNYFLQEKMTVPSRIFPLPFWVSLTMLLKLHP